MNEASSITRIFIAHILILVFLKGVTAQVDSVRAGKDYLKAYWTDTRDLITSPGRWDGNGWLRLAVFTAATAALTTVDKPVADFMRENSSHAMSRISEYGLEPMANIYAFGLMAGLLGHGYLKPDDRSRSTALMALESYLISGILVRVPKILAGRSRPDAWWEPGPYEWKGPLNGKSFPSGHAASAFSVASVVAFQYRDRPWVPVTAYSLAALTGLSRVTDHRHWLSDVFAGAVIGTLTGRFICNSHQRREISLEPVLISGISGIKIVYRQ